MMLRYVAETTPELIEKVHINSIMMAFLIFALGFGIAYIVILLLNKEV